MTWNVNNTPAEWNKMNSHQLVAPLLAPFFIKKQIKESTAMIDASIHLYSTAATLPFTPTFTPEVS